MRCVTFVADNAAKIVFGIETGMNGGRNVPSHLREMPVFVRVGGISKTPRPIASHVRLQPLYTRDMSGVDAFEKDSLAAPLEVLFRVHNRKLGAALLNAGIEPGEFENEIVERASEIVADFANSDGEVRPDKSLGRLLSAYNAVRRIRVELNFDSIRLPNLD